MRIKARSFDYATCPASLQPYIKPDQVFITPGTEYEVFALVVFQDIPSVMVLDDGHAVQRTVKDDLYYSDAPVKNIVDEMVRWPNWYPIWMFEIVDKSLPDGWLCNVFDDGTLILGPEFIARDQDAYVAMVELEPEQLERFRNHVARQPSTIV